MIDADLDFVHFCAGISGESARAFIIFLPVLRALAARDG